MFSCAGDCTCKSEKGNIILLMNKINAFTMIANLRHAIRENETVEIGGGCFRPDEMKDLVRYIEMCEESRAMARLLCANLEAGGTGHMTIVNKFRELDERVQ